MVYCLDISRIFAVLLSSGSMSRVHWATFSTCMCRWENHWYIDITMVINPITIYKDPCTHGQLPVTKWGCTSKCQNMQNWKHASHHAASVCSIFNCTASSSDFAIWSSSWDACNSTSRSNRLLKRNPWNHEVSILWLVLVTSGMKPTMTNIHQSILSPTISLISQFWVDSWLPSCCLAFIDGTRQGVTKA